VFYSVWAFRMRHQSLYLAWYIRVPQVKHDFRSSGVSNFRYNLTLGEVDMSINYLHGNPEATKLLARRYNVKPENVFISSEGTTGQNARIIRYLAEKNPRKNEAVVEHPTYEPLLRLVQEYFPHVRRVSRDEKEGYRLDADELRKVVSEKTGLFMLTNPHLPSGAVSKVRELKEVMAVAQEYGFYVLCDEIYAEFNRGAVPTILAVDSKLGIVTTSFTKAHGLGGLRTGIALADKEVVDELYVDTLNTIGGCSNVVEIVTVKLLTEGKAAMEAYKQKWLWLKDETERLLREKDFEYTPNSVSITYWVKTPVDDTYQWVNKHAIPRHSLAPVPGAFFLFKDGNKLEKSNMIRLGLGNINPDKPNLAAAFETLEKASASYKSL